MSEGAANPELIQLLTPDGNTAYFTTEFGLGLAIMGIVIAVIFARRAKALDRDRQPGADQHRTAAVPYNTQQ